VSSNPKKTENRYVNDLRRFSYFQSQFFDLKGVTVPLGLSVIFLTLVGLYVASAQHGISEDWLIVVVAAIVGGYMALNIGANDVANNMGPAVGGKVLTVVSAILIAAVCETAGALLAGGDVVKTVSKGIISPGDSVRVDEFRDLMRSEEHTSELQSRFGISYAVFCLKKKTKTYDKTIRTQRVTRHPSTNPVNQRRVHM